MASDVTLGVVAAVGVAGTLLGVILTNAANQSREKATRHHQDLLWMRDQRYEAYAAFIAAADVFLHRDLVVRSVPSGGWPQVVQQLESHMVTDLTSALGRVNILGPDSVADYGYALFEVVMAWSTSLAETPSEEYNAMVRTARNGFMASVRAALTAPTEPS